MLRKHIIRFSTIGLAFLLICSGCRSDRTTDTSPLSPMGSPLATPSGTSAAEDSPAATPKPMEPTAQDAPEELREFQLDEPLLAGETEVTGQGPAGVPILIVDVSYMSVIGEGRIGPDREFAIEVEPPLAEYSMVGIMFDETKDSPYTQEQLPCGDDCRDQPLVGMLFDRAPVTTP